MDWNQTPSHGTVQRRPKDGEGVGGHGPGLDAGEQRDHVVVLEVTERHVADHRDDVPIDDRAVFPKGEGASSGHVELDCRGSCGRAATGSD
ncbi:MAG TPA: hypothetical protein VEQ37_00135 [Actinomycetota bacterium]|nr:hypothetical protein [Actinomycetota bacterium]